MPNGLSSLDIMRITYSTYHKDWMGFKITKENPLTYHHIIKEEDGGPKTVENGALLTILAHRYLHTIERYDINMYQELNEILKMINRRKCEPNTEDYRKIIRLLSTFENRYVKVLTKNIKLKRYNYQTLKAVSTGKYSLYCPTNIRMAMMEGIDPVIYKPKSYKKSKIKKKIKKQSKRC